jgi:protease PrsW
MPPMRGVSVRDWLYARDGAPRLVGPGLMAFAVTTLIALVALHLLGTPRTEEDAARALLKTERAADAEALYARILEREPTVPHVLTLSHAHAMAKHAKLAFREEPKPDQAEPPDAMSNAALEAIVAALPFDVALVARFELLRDEDARGALEVAAMREPPMPWANHVLAYAALAEGDELAAASMFWREGSAFPERGADMNAALQSWMAVSAWDEAHERIQQIPAEQVSVHVRYELAIHDGDWRSAARVMPGLWRDRLSLRFLWLAAIAALAWGFFAARLGNMGDRARFRAPLYFASFVLGVLSVVPTVLLIAVEEAKLHLVESGSTARDLLYFVFGVGLREEASKLLLFLPLVPILRKWGDKLDVLVCGAMVGLGFAAEENLGYLADENLHTGLGRFLTANFLHMAMTGILASATYDFIADREKHADELTKATLLVVGLHGAYDFLIAHHELGGGYAAMGVFVLLTKRFLDTVDVARKSVDRVVTPMHAFVLALAVVTGASLAHAIHSVGFKQGPLVMAEGMVGEAVIVIVFARVLSVF